MARGGGCAVDAETVWWLAPNGGVEIVMGVWIRGHYT